MPDWPLTSLLLAIGIGSVVGFLSGMFGVGGGFLLVPFLNAVLGIPMTLAVGSTACYTIGPATAALLAKKPSLGLIQLPLILAGGLFVGVWMGTRSLAGLQEMETIHVLHRSIPAVDLLVLSSYALLMSGISVTSLVDAYRSTATEGVHRRGLFSSVALRPVAVIPKLRPSHHSIPLLAWTGVAVGFLSGFLGMSGGLVLVPAAVFLLGLHVREATTVTVVVVWIVSVQSTIMHSLHGNVQLPLVAALLLSGTIGASIGAQFGKKMPASRLKLGFGLLVLVSAGIVFAKLWALWRASA